MSLSGSSLSSDTGLPGEDWKMVTPTPLSRTTSTYCLRRHVHRMARGLPSQDRKMPWKLATNSKKSPPGLAVPAPIKVTLGPHYLHDNPTHCQSLDIRLACSALLLEDQTSEKVERANQFLKNILRKLTCASLN